MSTTQLSVRPGFHALYKLLLSYCILSEVHSKTHSMPVHISYIVD